MDWAGDGCLDVEAARRDVAPYHATPDDVATAFPSWIEVGGVVESFRVGLGWRRDKLYRQIEAHGVERGTGGRKSDVL